MIVIHFRSTQARRKAQRKVSSAQASEARVNG